MTGASVLEIIKMFNYVVHSLVVHSMINYMRAPNRPFCSPPGPQNLAPSLAHSTSFGLKE